MKALLISCSLFIVSVLCSYYKSTEVKILHSVTDDRGLTSVVFSYRGDTMALDFLNEQELELLKINKFTGYQAN